MYPYIHLGPLTVGTFGLMLWLAAVCAGYVLHLNFKRFHVEADAISVVAFVTVLGVVGAKLWHVFEDPVTLFHYPAATLFDRAGFAWYGGLIAGILTLMGEGRAGKVGGQGMLDLAAPAAAVGYGVGRIGCFTSGDGDYGIPTTLPWGVHIHDDPRDPPQPNPPGLLVHPTPIYELLFSLALGWYLWMRGKRDLPIGQLTGEYLVLS